MLPKKLNRLNIFFGNKYPRSESSCSMRKKCLKIVILVCHWKFFFLEFRSTYFFLMTRMQKNNWFAFFFDFCFCMSNNEKEKHLFFLYPSQEPRIWLCRIVLFHKRVNGEVQRNIEKYHFVWFKGKKNLSGYWEWSFYICFFFVYL